MADVTRGAPGNEVAEITGLDVMVASLERRATEAASAYVPHDIVGGQDHKASKRARADARKDKQRLRAEYDDVVRPLRAALADADDRVAAALSPFDEVVRGYDSSIGAWEDLLRAERVTALEDTYRDYAPDLMALVPLGRLVGRYGSEPGSKWLLQGTNVEKARRLLCEAIDDVAAGEKTVAEAVDPSDLEEAKADYFASLDAGLAIAASQGRMAQRERVRALEDARRERNEVAESFAEAVGQPERGEVPPYIMCCYGSRADADAFAVWCEGRGIRATVRPTGGSIFRIVRK